MQTLTPFTDDGSRSGAVVVFVPRGSTGPDYRLEVDDDAPRQFDQILPGQPGYDEARRAAS